MNDRVPAVIVGIGEILDRPANLSQGLDPIGLMTEATKRALADAGHGPEIMGRIDSVDVMHVVSWRYENTASALVQRLGIAPSRAVYHPAGGEQPTRAIHDAAIRISSGESTIALICGGEAMHTSKKAHAPGIELPWPPRAKRMEHPLDLDAKVNPLALAHGVMIPTTVYPFYEIACTAAWGLTPSQANAESAQLCARFSEAASVNPFAWNKRGVSDREIGTPSEDNRPIAYPYLKLMVANPTVNLGSAVLVMSEREALELGLSPSRLIYIRGGAAANEAADYLKRDSYSHSPAQEAVLEAARDLAGERSFDHVELYSCFPCVPKMARRSLGMGDEIAPTVTGGLTFFGGPFSNYMGHAACAMVRKLRSEPGTGLLYGQGDLVTKHHALVLQNALPDEPLSVDYDVENRAAARRGPIPTIALSAAGECQLETFTVLYDRNGAVDRGVIIGRTTAGTRIMARVPANDRTTINRLLKQSACPVGLTGAVRTADDGLLEWSVQ